MSAWAAAGLAQTDIETIRILDVAEDTTQVNTITDIVAIQEAVSKSNYTDAHFADVWSKKSFINIGYNLSSTMKAKQAINLGYNSHSITEFNKIQSGMIQAGHSYTLHKGALANMVQINLDYTYVDLGFSYIKAEPFANEFDKTDTETTPDLNPDVNGDNNGDTNVFDPSTYYGYGAPKKTYLPWAAKKYYLTYGMTLGPSITVAPLTMLPNRQLHYLKLNLYYHIGYHAGIMYMDQKSNENATFDNVMWCHGLSQSYGVSLSWKSIGIGWESRFSFSPKFKSFSGENPKGGYKFDNTSSRIYISIRY